MRGLCWSTSRFGFLHDWGKPRRSFPVLQENLVLFGWNQVDIFASIELVLLNTNLRFNETFLEKASCGLIWKSFEKSFGRTFFLVSFCSKRWLGTFEEYIFSIDCFIFLSFVVFRENIGMFKICLRWYLTKLLVSFWLVYWPVKNCLKA